MNNFYTECPEGYRRHSNAFGEEDVEELQWKLRTTYRDQLLKYADGDITSAQRYMRPFTDVRLGKTDQQFFDDIDSALRATGEDPEAIAVLNKRIEESKNELRSLGERNPLNPKSDRGRAVREEQIHLAEELNKRILPAYRKLREMGYSHNDLHN